MGEKPAWDSFFDSTEDIQEAKEKALGDLCTELGIKYADCKLHMGHMAV